MDHVEQHVAHVVDDSSDGDDKLGFDSVPVSPRSSVDIPLEDSPPASAFRSLPSAHPLSPAGSPFAIDSPPQTHPLSPAPPSPLHTDAITQNDAPPLKQAAIEPSIANSARSSVSPSFASTFASDRQHDRESITSVTSSVSVAKKVRPESILINPGSAKLILGLAVVDFNHILGPTVEMAHPKSILEDEEMCKILPFLALPDGAHLNQEDYSYFHVVPTQPSVFASQPSTSSSPPPPQTLFGISCNRQIATSTLLSKEADVTRSTVQKAVVVLASKPLFGLIRDKLGVVTRAFFNQRDFRDHSILTDFCDGLESSIRAQLTESGVYMGTSLRELVYTFRHRTLMLLKLIILQKKVMFHGHPVERLCTYQYSLTSLIPGLLLALEDCGAPQLAEREKTLKRATEFKSSDRQSLLKFMGLPLDLFGKGSFFQPYMPLQQIDLMATSAYLCGTTNSIMTHQRDNIDLIVNIETNTFEFMDPATERLVALTPADRRWMDDIVHDVSESWNEADPQRPISMQFKGSDDYLRVKFEDYLCSVLSALKYQDFLQKSAKGNVTISGATGDTHVVQNFGESWLAAFRGTEAFAVWDRVTDPVIFDIVEPRHPCDVKVNAISDLGLRLTEGMHELKLDKNLESTREAISSVIATGSTSIFKAFEGVRSEVSNRLAAQRAAAAASAAAASAASATTPQGPSPAGSPHPSTSALPASSAMSSSPSSHSHSSLPAPPMERRGSGYTLAPPQPVGGGGLRPLSLGVGLVRRTSTLPADSTPVPSTPPPPVPTLADTASAARATLGAWGSGIGSFLSARRAGVASTPNPSPSAPEPAPPRTLNISTHAGQGFTTSPLASPTFEIRDLDKEREERDRAAAAAAAGKPQ